MTSQSHSTFRFLAASIFTFIFAAGNFAFAQAPVLQSAASRRAHGGVNYDIGLPLAGQSGIECRVVTAGGCSLVLNFDKNVQSGAAAITAGVATAGTPTFSATQMIVPLTGLGNKQAVTVAFSNVVPSGGGTAASGSVTFRILEGDVNGSGSVTVADVNILNYYVGSAVTPFNFRADLNFSNAFTVADVALAKLRVGNTVPGGAQSNTAPTVSTIADKTTTTGTATSAISFTVGDGQTPVYALGVMASSDNQTLLPDSKITLGGSGANRTITLAPAASQNGTARITLTVSDGLLTSSGSFTLTVTPSVGGGTARLFVATLTPEGSVQSPGSGSATLLLAADEASCILRVSYSNLTTTKTAMHTHGPADPGASGQILFDLDTTPPLSDGSWKWTFVNAGTTTVADQVAAIKAGRIYVNVHSSKYPSGELRGHFLAANGSQTFTPPANPPALPGGTPTANEAARFLIQATYGPTDSEIAAVQSQGYDGWITNQFNAGQTSMRGIIDARKNTEGAYQVHHIRNAWWKLANTAPDQLRQRVAFALSEMYVISTNASLFEQVPNCVGNYYDMLGRNAFGNFRTLIEDVTLSPLMGDYLNLLASKKADPTRGINPNENYPRELLQLFTVGVHVLHPDGTLKLDVNGQPIETYNQDVVMGFARALTGWCYNQPGTSELPAINYMDPMTPVPTWHETGTKLLLNGQTLAAGGTAQSDLKAALDNAFNHPNTGPFICRQLIQKLVCSNPSPGYVYRVAQEFNNNGSGVRGDMKAVIRAILTDYEARSSNMLANQGFGKLKEPILRVTAVMRGAGATSYTGLWAIDKTDDELRQTPLRSPTVFNFFEPGYVHPGTLASNGLVAPEFQITNESTTMSVANFQGGGIFTGYQYGDINFGAMPALQALAPNPTALVDKLNNTLCAGQLSSSAKTIIVNHLNTIPDNLTRARVAVFMIAISSQFATQQ